MPLPGEPLWLEADQLAALAWFAEKGSACQGCGNPVDETMTIEADDEWYSRALRCHACAARDRKAREFTSQGNADDAGMKYTSERRNS